MQQRFPQSTLTCLWVQSKMRGEKGEILALIGNNISHCSAAEKVHPGTTGNRIRRRRGYVAGLVLALGCVVSYAAPAKRQQADPKRYIEHVKFLASPELEGRGAGTKGLQLAAKYISEQFKSLGLEPGTSGDSYLQPLTVTTGARLRPGNRLTVRHDDTEETLNVGEDYIPMSFSSVGCVRGPVVFAGYGVSAQEYETVCDLLKRARSIGTTARLASYTSA